MDNVEAKVISAVLQDKQIHVLLQANVDALFKTHNDIWEFIRKYAENNAELPPTHLVPKSLKTLFRQKMLAQPVIT